MEKEKVVDLLSIDFIGIALRRIEDQPSMRFQEHSAGCSGWWEYRPNDDDPCWQSLQPAEE